jgi:uncharacterized protein (DUF1330 family)
MSQTCQKQSSRPLSHACKIGVASIAELPAGRAEVTLLSAAAVRPSAAEIAFQSSEENAMNRAITVGLSMLAGAALGAAAIQTLHAQAKPPAYVITEITIKDQDGYTKEFLPPVTKAIQDAGGKFIARGGKTITFQGAAPTPRVVVIQFESLEKTQAWNDSAAQVTAQKIGDKFATFRSFAVEGISQ